MSQNKQLGLSLLIFVSLGSMIGSGIFNSPKDLIGLANPVGTMITWLLGGAGALFLALVFVYLSNRKPELKSGVFAYAREGFGDYMGFNSAWGYWSLGWLGNVSYFVMFFKTLNDFLGERALTPLVSFLISSAILWFFYFILRAGVREGAILNFIVTVAKLLPILLVVVMGFTLVNGTIFYVPEWENVLASTGKITTPFMQIKDAMAIVLWCFVGIEAASVLSGRAKSQKTVRQAIVISILIVLSIYMLITFVAMAAVPAVDLYHSDTPLALLLSKSQIGNIGSVILQIGIMISVLGASLSWIILSVETMYAAAKDGVMPQSLARLNKKEVPINALLLTQVFTQIFLFSILSPKLNETYLIVITVGTTMVLIPYLLSSLYAVKLTFRDNDVKTTDKTIAIVGTLYSAYVIYAVGVKFLFLSLLFYTLGVFVFLKSRYDLRIKPKKWEVVVMILISVISIALLAMILMGRVEI